MRRLALVLSAVAIGVPTTTAGADFTPATMVSGTQQIPFDEATAPALSQDSRYVVFRGSLAGAPGIYRRDLETGEVTPVAVVDPPDAVAAPSVSADGRYVAFTTTAHLGAASEPSIDRGCPRVYVKDMQTGLYTLASALDGPGENAISYGAPCPAPEGEGSRLPIAGSQAAAGVALSADGQRVVFTVLSRSDLTSGQESSPSTPASQVVLRDLGTNTTTLVSATPGGAPTEGGGAFPSEESERLGAASPEVKAGISAGSSAAISADGSTVAWMGTNIPTQLPPASDVVEGMAHLGPVSTEIEPLWRRVADGAGAVTKRLLSQDDLNFYFTETHELPEAASGGTLYPGSQGFVAPVLSADGRTVAVLSNAPTSANEASYRFLHSAASLPTEAYIVRVEDGPAPPQVSPLTATASFTAPNAIFDGVTGVALSPDGSRVAFDTRRTTFVQAPPTLISPPAPEASNGYTYEANLALNTLQRVTSTFDGSAPNGEPGPNSFSADDLSLAFASTASNLFYGDATPGASEVYVTNELASTGQLAGQSISPPPAISLPLPTWVLSVTASAQRDGSLLLDAQVPGPGKLAAQATAQLPTPVRSSRGSGAKKASKARGRRSSAKARNARSRPSKPRSAAGSAIPHPIVARATSTVRGASEIRWRLRVGASYRVLLAGHKSLYCIVRATFTAPGHAALTQEVPVTLRITAAKARKKPAKAPPGSGVKR
jgi:hypothetical protein